MDPLLQGEQAVLGAVLLDPRQLGNLDWLEPRDFYRPAHQALFAALRKLRTDGHPGLTAEGPVPLAWLNDTLAEAGKHVRGLTASYPHTLIAACPRPANAPVYGRMVLEGSIHRTVTEHAIRLLSVAQADAAEHEVDGTLTQADVLAGVLDELATLGNPTPGHRPEDTLSPCRCRTSRSGPGGRRAVHAVPARPPKRCDRRGLRLAAPPGLRRSRPRSPRCGRSSDAVCSPKARSLRSSWGRCCATGQRVRPSGWVISSCVPPSPAPPPAPRCRSPPMPTTGASLPGS
ncbi:DnaB-like helicase N-terminal domain-containing protein [Kitasatospora sp. NPDC059599]|uniref:DnaB-like helicase N-terminal domain-containing protein n=1 Tax=Kitasatospora sp. NPDC059599 TaxID=3346880 RepID=UPI0036CCC3B0